MPLTWVEPDIAVRHRGVTVYHVYKDRFEDGPLAYWYTTDIAECDEPFDIRDLPEYQAAPDKRDHLRILRVAISAGSIKEA